MEITDLVFLFNVHQFLAHQPIVGKETLLAALILRGDVCLTQHHQIVNIVAGIEKKSTHGRIRHFVVGDVDGAHVEIDELFDVFHTFVKREFQAAEERLDHFHADEVMVVEGPAYFIIPSL